MTSVVLAQAPLGNDQYAFKIYAVNSAFYPIVEVYFRTWDQNRDPLPNVNYANIGLSVKGRNYDPLKIDPKTRQPQYEVATLQSRTDEGSRTVLVLDCSLSMEGKPFTDAQRALDQYVAAKRPADQIAVVAIRDTDQGYQLVSGFEKDPALLSQRIGDIRCDGKQTRLYDSIAAAMEMCATASQGGTTNEAGEHAILNTILVLSDGLDEGSAVARDELINRIGELDIPIPINSLAYSKVDRSAFKNLEALSKASFGRYWTHDDSQQFGATIQKIHEINRSDYVLTFRSYVPVDGEKHPIRIGISWPSNTGRFVFDSAEFEAIDSPALYVERTKAVWEKLNAAFPKLPDNCPYMDCSQPLAANETAITNENTPHDATDSVDFESAETDAETNGFFRDNAALLIAAGAIALIVLAVLLWVKQSSADSPRTQTISRTQVEAIVSTDSATVPTNGGDGKERVTTTRF